MIIVQSPNTIPNTPHVSVRDWSVQWRSIAQDWRWFFTFIAIGSFSSAIAVIA